MVTEEIMIALFNKACFLMMVQENPTTVTIHFSKWIQRSAELEGILNYFGNIIGLIIVGGMILFFVGWFLYAIIKNKIRQRKYFSKNKKRL